MHVFAPLAERARETPDAIFCHFNKAGVEREVTVGTLMRDAGHMAARVRAAGGGPGSIVPIVLEHRVELYSSFIGGSLAGALPTLLPPMTHKQHEAAFIASMQSLLRRIDPPCIVGSQATLPTLDGSLPRVDVDSPAPYLPHAPPLWSGDTGALFCLQHSSGTTGLKKGVCISHRAVLAQVASYASAIELAPGDRIASWLPLYHDMGLVTAFLMPAIHGIPVVSLDALEWSARPTILLDAIERFRATLCWLPNFAFHHVSRMASPNRSWDLSSLRLVVNCSEPCRAPAFAAFERLVPRPSLQVSYAMAECVFAATQTALGTVVRSSTHPDYAEFLSSGTPGDGVEICVRDEEGRAVEGGQLGEIFLKGSFLFDGYFREPERTAKHLSGGWYATGDLGFVESGELFVVGRIDDVLNINGRKILAHEVEAALAGVDGVAPGRVLVFAEHDPTAGASRLSVAVERATNLDKADDVLTGDVRRAVLAACALSPSSVALVERGTLVKSTSGKLSRAASLELLRARNLVSLPNPEILPPARAVPASP